MLKGTLAPRLLVRIFILLIALIYVLFAISTNKSPLDDKKDFPLIVYATREYGLKQTEVYITNIRGSFNKRIWSIESFGDIKANWSPRNSYVFMYSNFTDHMALAGVYTVGSNELETFYLDETIVDTLLVENGIVVMITKSKILLYYIETNTVKDISIDSGYYKYLTLSPNQQFLAFVYFDWLSDLEYLKFLWICDLKNNVLIPVTKNVSVLQPLDWESDNILVYKSYGPDNQYVSNKYSTVTGTITQGEVEHSVETHENFSTLSSSTGIWRSGGEKVEVTTYVKTSISSSGKKYSRDFMVVYLNNQSVRVIMDVTFANLQN